jgi:hypothetical protein
MKDFSMDVLVWKAAGSMICVDVEHCTRQAGQSNYSFQKLIRLAFAMVSGALSQRVFMALVLLLCLIVTSICAFFIFTIGTAVGFQINFGLFSIACLFMLAALATTSIMVVKNRLVASVPFEIAEIVGSTMSITEKSKPGQRTPLVV